MRRNIVRLTESDLSRLIKESVYRIINEGVEETSEEAWDNLRLAKESGDPREISIARRNLERALEREDKLETFEVPNGIAKATPNSRFIGKYTDLDDGSKMYTRDPRFKEI